MIPGAAMTPERHDTAETTPTFGRYRIRGVLGEGGLGRLYLAEQTGIEGFTKIVALKRILPHLADSAPFRTLFLNEARVAARLEHPNIVATYEFGEVEGAYFTAMEYLPGEDLAAILARCETPSPMPVEIAAFLAQQCAHALEYAHEVRDARARGGLIHRDVNPAKIFVTYHGTVKLLDFGVVKRPGGVGHAHLAHHKYAYCAPEQIEGDAVDHRADIFSLGIVLWECLSGHRLFDNPTDGGTIDAVRSQTIAPPSLLRPEVPIALDAISLRCLTREREHRYQSARELSEALDGFLAEERRRPSSNTVGQWLESMFGTERASLKKNIAQGSDVEGALTALALADATKPPTAERSGVARRPLAVRPRPLWSTATRRRPPAPGPTPDPLAIAAARPAVPSRRALVAAAIAVATVVVLLALRGC
jgi:serine/threonine-protein kinase